MIFICVFLNISLQETICSFSMVRIHYTKEWIILFITRNVPQYKENCKDQCFIILVLSPFTSKELSLILSRLLIASTFASINFNQL